MPTSVECLWKSACIRDYAGTLGAHVSSCDYRPNRGFNPSITSTPPFSGSPMPKQLRTKSSKKIASNSPMESARLVRLLSNGSVYVLGLPRDGRRLLHLWHGA